MNAESADLDRLAAEPVDEHDLATLALLREVYEVADPVPDGLVERIQFAITLDDLEAEVARLQREAVPQLAARTDDATTARTVTFTSETLTTMMTITPTSGERVRLDGWAAPGGGIEVELRRGDSSTRQVADEDGRFVFEDVPHGLAQLVLRHTGEGGDHPVVTPAIEV